VKWNTRESRSRSYHPKVELSLFERLSILVVASGGTDNVSFLPGASEQAARDF
jgi:hypothetical protein